MTRTDATTDTVDMHMTHKKYREIIGTAEELGGMISDSTRLNMTTERRMVISENDRHGRCERARARLRSVSFSPLSGARRKPRMVRKLIRKQGTGSNGRKRDPNSEDGEAGLTDNVREVVQRASTNANRVEHEWIEIRAAIVFQRIALAREI